MLVSAIHQSGAIDLLVFPVFDRHEMFRSTLVRQTRNICSPVLRVSAKPTALRVSLSRPAIVKAPLRLMAAKAKAETTPTASFQASAWAQVRWPFPCRG